MHHTKSFLKFWLASGRLPVSYNRGYLTWTVYKECHRQILYHPLLGKTTTKIAKRTPPQMANNFFLGVMYHASSSHNNDNKTGGINKKKLPDSTEEEPSISSSNEGSSSALGSSGEKQDTSAPVQSSYVKVVPKTSVPKTDRYTDNLRLTVHDVKKKFMLSDEDIKQLKGKEQRSPYSSVDHIVVYMEKDVRALAYKKYGGQANFLEMQRRQEELRERAQKMDVTQLSKRILHLPPKVFTPPSDSKEIDKGTVWACQFAVFTNFVAFGAKGIIWYQTGFDSMFAEMLHSLVDVTNQAFLLYGVYKASKKPDSIHPYGYSQIRPLTSFLSALVICGVGAVSIYHGILGFFNPGELVSPFYAYIVLAVSGICEAISLRVVLKTINQKKSSDMSMKNWLYAWKDPTLNLILLEDSAAVIGVALASAGVGLTHLTSNPFYDSLGSVCIGGLLMFVANFILRSNLETIIGKSIPPKQLAGITSDLECDKVVRGVHDVKTTDMGGATKFKAEVDFDGKMVSLNYLSRQNKKAILEEMKCAKTVEDAEAIIVKHGEGISDQLGMEIDRLESNLKKKHTHLRHIDIEIN
ncbi:zinc transporter 9 isoform X2 [Lingula anatina]|uniref:Proton-coupled zinc antiporter SLC30A9, mitochondrial n=2 Tax=Lingula anatina TaxID=7574 RepID=A0A1S3KFU5_LINAN|nr:zinc transporter 9 isoform X2 [Lingula anatina]XP_023932801.1 zinc transporter 9 isoform X2 [Lingula anatina]|eukprot:XP_023932800.1 zinc transporter 9 isoform X2 [Lingula anatina]